MNIKRAKEEIKNTVRAYLEKDENGQYRIPSLRQRPILLMGPPGIGKTQIMEQVAQECEIALVAYTITHHTRQSAVGLPFIRQVNFAGKDYSVTEYTMSEIIASIYRKMESTGLKEGILFIDEINCVSETLAPTMLQFLQYKTFGNQAIPQGWIIVAAGNPPEYNKSVREFDIVTLDRVRRMDLEPDLTVWKEYARGQRLHPALLSYLELRPQNFYKINADVDGTQFVTARGWEDLSGLLEEYQRLGLTVDEDVVSQYLQHREIAKDVASYLDLYRKYADDYGVSDILQGLVDPKVYQRVYAAPFDERLSLVGLILSGVNTLIIQSRDTEAVTDQCYQVLKEFRSRLNEGIVIALMIYQELVEEYEGETRRMEQSGLADRRTLTCRKDAARLLRGWMPDSGLDGEGAFQQVRGMFNHQVRLREESLGHASEALENAFDFMEAAFANGQEMVVFVTELTLGPDSHAFITENGCERYFQYNKTLMLDSRRAALMAELEQDDLRSQEGNAPF